MKKHNNTVVRFFQILTASIVFSLLTFCSSLKAEESFSQDFPSRCFKTDYLIKQIGEYTILQHEEIYRDGDNVAHDILIGVNKNKKVMLIRQIKGKISIACIISEFTYNPKV